MTDVNPDRTEVWSRGTILFLGSGALFSEVALRTVETELECPVERMPDMNALRFSLASGRATTQKLRMIVVDEANARDLLVVLDAGAPVLPKCRRAIAFEDGAFAADLFARETDRVFRGHVSLLPMNTNITNWVRLLQLIDSGGHYVPPEVMQIQPRAMALAAAVPEPALAGEAEAPAPMDGLTPRETEVLAMVAAGSPNKLIANELNLSEHTVKLYMHRIIGKLGVKNRTEAAILFHRSDNG